MIYHVFDEVEQFSEFYGGAISRWAANVLRDDSDTNIVCYSADDSWGFAAERIHRVPSLRFFQKLRARRFYPFRVTAGILRSLYRPYFPKLRSGDVVWVHGQPDVALALSKWTKSAGATIVLHLHGSLFVTNPAPKMRAVAAAVDRLVFCSNFLYEEARARFPQLQRTAILYNGADASLFYPAAGHNDVPVVVQACRLIPEKGVHTLVDAMRILQERGVSVRAKIFGSSFFGGSRTTSYIESLHKRAPDNVSFEGYCAGRKLADQLRAADVFCLPAVYQDPFPLAVLEAMATGLPVVATRRGGIPEALVEGGGALVPHDNPVALADALQTLVQSREQRVRVGEEGYRSFLKNFTWDAVRQSYHRLIDEMHVNATKTNDGVELSCTR